MSQRCRLGRALCETQQSLLGRWVSQVLDPAYEPIGFMESIASAPNTLDACYSAGIAGGDSLGCTSGNVSFCDGITARCAEASGPIQCGPTAGIGWPGAIRHQG
jgi:hypothetical protein